MSDLVLQKDVGALVVSKAMSRALSFTSGGGSDNASYTGISIDRFAAFQNMPRALDIDIAYDATIGSGSTLSFTVVVQDSADNSTWADYATESGATVVATGPSGGGNVQGVKRFTPYDPNRPTGSAGISINGARRYVRTVFKPALSRGATDTAVCQAIGVFAGFDTLPGA